MRNLVARVLAAMHRHVAKGKVVPQAHGHIRGTGDYGTEVVGESHYQPALRSIAGNKTEESKSHRCRASIVPEPDNPFDKNACAVLIGGGKVGYLPAAICKSYLAELGRNGLKKTECLTVDALIVGGWRDAKSEGHYGVKLDLPWIEES